MSGSLYDWSTAIFSPEGKLYQVEYATKVIDNGETVIGIKCKDGIVLASEKLIFSPLLVEQTNKRIYNINENIGMLIGGRIPDGRIVMERAREETKSYEAKFDVPITGSILADRIAQYVHVFTLYWSIRPLGTTALIASYDQVDGYKLNMVDPNGS